MGLKVIHFFCGHETKRTLATTPTNYYYKASKTIVRSKLPTKAEQQSNNKTTPITNKKRKHELISKLPASEIVKASHTKKKWYPANKRKRLEGAEKR